MYKYIYVSADTQGLFTVSNHRELIDKYSSEGWRFIAAIPTVFTGHGVIKQFDLVFEKEE
ncbi:DUF4177 domain-containing protein [Oceanirhabdus sp. W0125-5]|uniref:DUF4177 domain-containing protein n=1 Tax=Oceanirhabdus sp. W0125-5 TaxID=2999116 RepID=UPI0022F2C5CC|nr:DUF4177 domain-containing protein [Oceanirhabdus sp. W0125-5]WBW98415.1 DUF4177 domain-containing protein [Oceanirhabdus sp. W0125-5]